MIIFFKFICHLYMRNRFEIEALTLKLKNLVQIFDIKLGLKKYSYGL